MDPRHAVLFEPIQVGAVELRSRVFGSAHQPGLAEDGRPGPRYIAYQRERARSGLGMQITGATPIAPSRLWNPATMILNIDDSIVPAYRRLAEAVHAEGGRMLAQLLHPGAGEFGGTSEVLSASLHVSELTRQVAREISRAELERVQLEYAAAADRCRRGELDGVEIAIGWGYLLASFVSPRMNQRHDEYGGDLVARLRYPIEVLAAVRHALGADRILGVRLCGDELLPDGITAEQAPEIARLLAASGHIDYLNVIAGTNMARLPRVDHWPATPAGVGIWRHLARAVREVVDLPVATVGRVVSPDVAADILTAGDADLVGLARPLIADPTWLSKARSGRAAETRPCTAVNACINALLDEEPIHCMVNAELGREGTVEESEVGQGRTAVVVGGGPGGIEAARRLSARGFRVVLLERDDALGGQVRAWSSGPARTEVRRVLGWWADDLRRRRVDVRLGATATVTAVLAEAPSLVVVATGARPIPHPVTGAAPDGDEGGAAGPAVVDGVTAFAGVGGRHVLVVDEMGRADALLLADALVASPVTGRRVTLVTTCLHPGEDEGITTLYPLLRSLGRAGVELVERHRWAGCDGPDVRLVNVFDASQRLVRDVDVVVPWCGAAPVADLAPGLRASGVPVHLVGDALLPRRVADAVREGAEVAWSLRPGGRPR